jgi:hypothetical protein
VSEHYTHELGGQTRASRRVANLDAGAEVDAAEHVVQRLDWLRSAIGSQ